MHLPATNSPFVICLSDKRELFSGKKNEALLLMMVTFLTNLQESKGRLSDSLCVFQSDRSRRGEQDDDPERGYRVRPNPAEAGD